MAYFEVLNPSTLSKLPNVMNCQGIMIPEVLGRKLVPQSRSPGKSCHTYNSISFSEEANALQHLSHHNEPCLKLAARAHGMFGVCVCCNALIMALIVYSQTSVHKDGVH